MTDLFRATGECLFGPSWQSPLARALDVNLRNVQRWAAGDHPPPDFVWPVLATLLREQGKRNAALLRRIASR